MSSQVRRVPQCARGSRRVSSILSAAAEVFAEVGYEAATMKEFAQRANASIGTIYQYFADKDAVVHAIRTNYVEDMERRWQPLGEQFTTLPIETLVDQSLDLLISFIEEHPAYIPLIVTRKNAPSGRKSGLDLRKRFSALVRSRRPDLSEEIAMQLVSVIFQVLRGLDTLYATAKQTRPSATDSGVQADVNGLSALTA
jgi:AcrR family transcriptional regulator